MRVKASILGILIDLNFDCNSSDSISTTKKRLELRNGSLFSGNKSLFHKNRELLDDLLVKDYAVQADDTFEIKEKDSRQMGDYLQEISRCN